VLSRRRARNGSRKVGKARRGSRKVGEEIHETGGMERPEKLKEVR
jgi:hypothetical protein